MCKSNFENKDCGLYVPELAEIVEVVAFTEKEKFFRLKLLSKKSLGHDPGQFVQVSVFGVGEAPISISSPPVSDCVFDLCVRKVGDVTSKLHCLKKGDKIYVRGPFGHGFTKDLIAAMEGRHLLFILGGLGYVPARSLINLVTQNTDKYEKITILNGMRSQKDRLYAREIENLSCLGKNVDVLEIVDVGDDLWKGEVGVITKLIPKVDFRSENVTAIVVGPPVMYKFVLKMLLDRKVLPKDIFVSLERRMKCGVGKCGHCQMEGVYVCRKGPVFNYADIIDNEEVF